MVTESHLPAAEAMTEVSHLPDRTNIGGPGVFLRRVARGKR